MLLVVLQYLGSRGNVADDVHAMVSIFLYIEMIMKGVTTCSRRLLVKI